MKTLEKVKPFLDDHTDSYDIRYLPMTDPANHEVLASLNLPTEHFPFGVAIDGRTSARIGGTTVVFAQLPDFMHHIGKYQGNWSLQHLEMVLQDNDLLLPDNPVVESGPGKSEVKPPVDKGTD